ncbi:ubiquilin-1-like isoform X2 [Halichondria panicea]|uniref:ubiquilin-1-like isoform X2 n=1 Tax=Halichondria panicea TaxID=6063 RepID=UPI00312B8055
MAEDSQAKDVPVTTDSGKDEDSKVLNLSIKTTKKKESIQVPVDCTVKQLKELLCKLMDAPVPQQCLIFAGKILKEEETLEKQGIKDGVTIHLVVRSSSSTNKAAGSGSGSSQAPPAATTGTTTTTSTAPPPQQSTAVPGPSPFGMFGAPQGDLQQQMAQVQQQLQSNPEMMQQMMESPMMQNFLSNPEALQSVLTSNPQMQQLMERNPELSHILHNPELMRQALEMTRNPAAMRELMRSQDRQLSNIESLPGGFNALARMYTEIQEPMMDAAQESLQQQMQNNPFSALFSQQQGSPDPGASVPQGTTNTDPLPNPWAPPTATPPGTTTTTTSGSNTRPATTGGGAGGPPSMMNPAMMSQMMGGAGMGAHPLAQNPELMAQMMQSPMFQQTMQRMASNPEMMEQMIRNNPMFAGNPQATEMARQASQMMGILYTLVRYCMYAKGGTTTSRVLDYEIQIAIQIARDVMPPFSLQMGNPEMRQMLTNPEAVRAMMQIGCCIRANWSSLLTWGSTTDRPTSEIRHVTNF